MPIHRRRETGRFPMGVFSILLGILSFLGFTGVGTLLANALVEQKTKWSSSFEFLANLSNTSLTVGVIAVFAIFGLLICTNLVVNGLTYNKVCKIEKQRRRKH